MRCLGVLGLGSYIIEVSCQKGDSIGVIETAVHLFSDWFANLCWSLQEQKLEFSF